jgi:hypothetical protein
MTALIEFTRIAWPGLLVLAGYITLIVHAARAYRRRHPRGRYRVFLAGPREELVLEAQHELTEGEARDVAALVREAGRVLATRRDDLIAQGINPRELLIPLAPDEGRQP